MNKFLVFLLGFLIVGCSLKPELVEPEANYTPVVENNFSYDKEWWKQFNDETLNSLMQKALENNTDLRIAFVRLEQAAATLGIDRSNLFPKLDANAGASRGKTQANSTNTQSGQSRVGNNFNLGLNLSYEVDLWGKYRDTFNASEAAYTASAYDYEVAYLTLTANVAKTYFNVIKYAKQVQILTETVQAYTMTYELKQEQFNAGGISEYELYQSKAELDKAKAMLVSTQVIKDSNEKALMILVSSTMDDILYKSIEAKELNEYAIEIPQGITSEVLLLRPDVKAGLKRLEEKNYLVGVARTAYLPNLSLTGLLGFESRDLDTLVEGGSKTWNVAGNFLMPIFHFGEISSSVDLAKLTKDEAFLNYENILKMAFGEIRTALNARSGAYENNQNYANLLEAQSRIYELAQFRYENGNSALIELLDAQRNYLSARISYSDSNFDLIIAIVDVIKAFGGGFNASENLMQGVEEKSNQLDMKFREQ
ncbi:efflux transporter outer membrane subunit [Campylobacter sp. US33a]|uniref:efflux transporter outer membrane subunit n=1 Tax=Campylobacter sp. US33a TaxID=2498120 RepID=UPI00106761D2|nr:TolC family protein [Campylobacter sp. US33a]TEY03496.1 TolC family protein [Campylobacter sp. US33a]